MFWLIRAVLDLGLGQRYKKRSGTFWPFSSIPLPSAVLSLRVGRFLDNSVPDSSISGRLQQTASKSTSRYCPYQHVLRSSSRKVPLFNFQELLMDLHWLRVPQRIQYELCVLVYGCPNGTAPGYLSDLTVSVGSTARRQLRSASTSDLVVPPIRRASIGDRAFA